MSESPASVGPVSWNKKCLRTVEGTSVKAFDWLSEYFCTKIYWSNLNETTNNTFLKGRFSMEPTENVFCLEIPLDKNLERAFDHSPYLETGIKESYPWKDLILFHFTVPENHSNKTVRLFQGPFFQVSWVMEPFLLISVNLLEIWASIKHTWGNDHLKECESSCFLLKCTSNYFHIQAVILWSSSLWETN